LYSFALLYPCGRWLQRVLTSKGIPAYAVIATKRVTVCTMAEQKDRKLLALKEKVHLIRFLETNSERKTAERFYGSMSTVSNIQRRKREYLERYGKESGDVQRKRNRTSLDQVNEAALSWFKQMRAGNARISGPVTQEVARRFALEFELTGFQASSGRLEKFMLRHKISQKILCGESNEVPVEVLEDFIAKFRYFASGFKEESIFNADECVLLFKAMPDRSLALKGDKCKSGSSPRKASLCFFALAQLGRS
ncbi:hypothetical protein M513_07719, partial [Trichuris suis]